jgi:hypothetical protein
MAKTKRRVRTTKMKTKAAMLRRLQRIKERNSNGVQ